MSIEFPGDVLAAQARIRGDIRRTPLTPVGSSAGQRARGSSSNGRTIRSPAPSSCAGPSTGSGRFRPRPGPRGVVSASTGNHGLAIAHAARLEGIGLTLFLPRTAAPVKRAKIEALGVDIRTFGDDCGATEVHAREYAERAGVCSSFPRTTIPPSSPGREPSGSRSWRMRRTSMTSSSPSAEAGSSPGSPASSRPRTPPSGSSASSRRRRRS